MVVIQPLSTLLIKPNFYFDKKKKGCSCFRRVGESSISASGNLGIRRCTEKLRSPQSSVLLGSSLVQMDALHEVVCLGHVFSSRNLRTCRF